MLSKLSLVLLHNGNENSSIPIVHVVNMLSYDSRKIILDKREDSVREISMIECGSWSFFLIRGGEYGQKEFIKLSSNCQEEVTVFLLLGMSLVNLALMYKKSVTTSLHRIDQKTLRKADE